MSKQHTHYFGYTVSSMFSSATRGASHAVFAGVSRSCAAAFLLAFAPSWLVVPGLAATLEQLTFDQMTAEATDVVYGRVLGSQVRVQGDSIYTHYSVEVTDRWKGSKQLVMDVVLPGGEAGGLRQTFAGVPQLVTGKQYVMFLWTGSSGRTQLLGLTQGLFEVSENLTGEIEASRGPSPELMLDRSGKAVQDQPVRMRLSDMSTRVKNAAPKKAAQ